MYSYETILLIVCPLIFCAGFVDAVAGGGGLIALPTYLFAGLPIHIAYGTNKFASSIGTTVATIKFFRSGKIKLKPALIAAFGALIGSYIGARLVVMLDEIYLQYCLIIVLPIVAIFLLFNRGFGDNIVKENTQGVKLYILCFAIGSIIGAYDGFFGPGTGTFLVLAFTTFCGFDIITSTGNAKIVNLSSVLTAAVVFLINGKVSFAIGIPAAMSAVLGSYLGAHFAIKKGAKFIKPVMVIVIIILFIKIAKDIL